MENNKNCGKFLENLLPLAKKISELEEQRNNILISILNENLTQTEEKEMIERKIYKEPYSEEDYLCNNIFFNEPTKKQCPIYDNCEYLTKIMGNGFMPCEVIYLKLKKEDEI